MHNFTRNQSPDGPFDRWYAVQVMPRHEKRVAWLLQYKGYDQFVPLRKQEPQTSEEHKEKPLFPGYVFCRLTSEANGLVVTTPGVIRILSYGGTPVALSAEEVKSLYRITDAGVPAESSEIARVGVPVQIESGPLSGLVGLLVEIKKKQKLLISIELLRRSVVVEVNNWDVRVLPRPALGDYVFRQSSASIA
jgi:transcription antitermination factor NusG